MFVGKRENTFIKTELFKQLFRLSRARRISENAFGILVHRFIIFRTPMCSTQNNIIKFVMAAVSLHNWLMSSSPNYSADCPPKPSPGGLLALSELLNEPRNLTALERRKEFRDFFRSLAPVPWQDDMINY